MKLLLFLILLNPLYTRADWKEIQRQDSAAIRGQVKVSELVVSDGSHDAELSFVYFRAGDVRLESVSNLEQQFSSLNNVIKSTGAIAGVNGGYFDEKLRPVGLLISNGRVLHRLQKAPLLTGIFYVKGDLPFLVRTQHFPGISGVQQAIQCGPFLVDAGRIVAGLENSRTAARTFIFHCSASLWGFGICRSVTLAEMAKILIDVSIVPEHHVYRALNFDGGYSTAFYAQTDRGTILSEGRPVVSDYLVAKAKD
ncbi:MAG TPA: phosphodiester glycosidase family protein [Chthoniobacterales bacterium]|jgi:exopolysaccharide biosynthesis protein|nr:phosphodiester glycosidase family protein [Chthoniobacterales bacterium]